MKLRDAFMCQWCFTYYPEEHVDDLVVPDKVCAKRRTFDTQGRPQLVRCAPYREAQAEMVGERCDGTINDEGNVSRCGLTKGHAGWCNPVMDATAEARQDVGRPATAALDDLLAEREGRPLQGRRPGR